MLFYIFPRGSATSEFKINQRFVTNLVSQEAFQVKNNNTSKCATEV